VAYLEGNTLKGCERMDSKSLERLKNQAINDLKEFLPKGCFKLEEGLRVNGKELSWNEKWECMTAMYGNKICYESDCNIINITPRQYAAAKVLYALGNSTNELITEVQVKAKEYFDYLTEQELKPLLSFLENDQKQSILETAALQTDSIEKNIKTEKSDTQETKTPEITSSSIPGKIPRNAINRLAIEVAWEIECATKKRATANDVILKLHKLVETNAILLERIPHGVMWSTRDGTEAKFNISACRKTISGWNDSRQ
jgi:hypothetical protein